MTDSDSAQASGVAIRWSSANPPDAAAIRAFVAEHRNWGRWGEDDERGTLNFVTDETVKAGLRAVRAGKTVSLSRPFPTLSTGYSPALAYHQTQRVDRADGGLCLDTIISAFHGLACTHIDSLNHMWGDDGMWNGRPADPSAQSWSAIDTMRSGVLARGLLLDIPRYRGVPHVSADNPVTSWDLEEVQHHQGVDVRPGDAVVIYSGRDEYDRGNTHPWGYEDTGASWTGVPSGTWSRPGLDVSCLRYIREVDCSVVVWDMMDALPHAYGLDFGVHAALYLFGTPLVDNASLGELVAECRAREQHEFLLCLAPLPIPGGSGSPLNPLAVL